MPTALLYNKKTKNGDTYKNPRWGGGGELTTGKKEEK